MRRTALAVLVALLLSAPPLHAASADGTGSIQAAYQVMDAGIAQKNLAKACAYLESDFTNGETTGLIEDLQRYQYGLSTDFAECSSIRAHSVVQKVSLSKSGQVVATVRQVLVMTYLNPNTLRKSSIVAQDVAQDVWVRTAQGWRQKSSRNLTASTTMDGRPGLPTF